MGMNVQGLTDGSYTNTQPCTTQSPRSEQDRHLRHPTHLLSGNLTSGYRESFQMYSMQSSRLSLHVGDSNLPNAYLGFRSH